MEILRVGSPVVLKYPRLTVVDFDEGTEHFILTTDPDVDYQQFRKSRHFIETITYPASATPFALEFEERFELPTYLPKGDGKLKWDKVIDGVRYKVVPHIDFFKSGRYDLVPVSISGEPTLTVGPIEKIADKAIDYSPAKEWFDSRLAGYNFAGYLLRLFSTNFGADSPVYFSDTRTNDRKQMSHLWAVVGLPNFYMWTIPARHLIETELVN